MIVVGFHVASFSVSVSETTYFWTRLIQSVNGSPERLGQAAAEKSDFVILTSDNPRSEDPLAIMNDALVGLRRYDTPHLIEVDRAKAIRRGIEQAQAGDVVIIAGKGHEPYQILKEGRIPFDDREVARQLLHSFGYRK